jgi:hypothetical protein
MMTHPVDDEELLVHNWRVERHTRIGVPGALAEVYADHLDWHEVAPAGAARLPPAAGPAHCPLMSRPVNRPDDACAVPKLVHRR